jgi:hypothetical protein
MSTLKRAVDDFVSINPGAGDPDHILGTTRDLVSGYCQFFNVLYPDFKGRVLYLKGSRVEFPRWHADYADVYETISPQVQHRVLVFDDNTVVDFCYRVLDSEGPFPLITSLDSLKNVWLTMSYELGDIECIDTIEARLGHKRRDDKYTFSPGDISQFQLCYNHAEPRVASGDLIFTGTEDDNVLLKRWNHEYKKLFAPL